MKNYVNEIFKISKPYMLRDIGPLGTKEVRARCVKKIKNKSKKDTIKIFSEIYFDYLREIKQKKRDVTDVDYFLQKNTKNIKVIWGDCLEAMQSIQSYSIKLMVTSPPYYNAREYSTWPDLDSYLEDMSVIIKESYRVLDNHRAFVFNVGDITGNDHRHTKSSWGGRRIPLGAYFINIFEKAGFKFIDDFIWDKGQVESQRHKNGDTPFPYYQYPMNCYEHILVFFKHEIEQERYPCPVCGCLKVNGNAYSGVGIKSWECKNEKCSERSKSNRGKRFSARSIMMDKLKSNKINPNFVKKWRRDIVPINPVIKVNCKGENILGHTAPYPNEIPEFAVTMYSGKGDTVLDPFAGSFTSAIVASKLGRIGVGIELNKDTFRDSIVTNLKRNECGFEELEM